MHIRIAKLSTWLVAGLLWTGCSPSTPETQNIIIAPAPSVAAPLGTDVVEQVATTFFVSRGSLQISVTAGDDTHLLRGPLLQGAVRTTDLDGFTDAVGEFDVISEGWRCDNCDPLVPVARQTLFPTERNPYLHMTLQSDGTGMLLVDWTRDDQPKQGRFAATVTGTQRDQTVQLVPASDSQVFTTADKRALARALGVSRVDDVTLSVELHLTNDPVRAGSSASVRVTSPVDDGDSRPLWEELPASRSGSRSTSPRPQGANYETRAILDGAGPTPEFVNESGG